MEDNKNVIHCYFKRNPTQKDYTKMVTEIWAESSRFNNKPKICRLSEYNLKKDRFSELEVLEICGQVSCEEHAQKEPSTRA